MGIFVAAVLIIGAVFLAGCTQQAPGTAGPAINQKVVIGAMPFNEQYILSEMLALLLEKEGYTVEVKSGLQNTILYEGVRSGDIDVYVEYTSAALYLIPQQPEMNSFDPAAVYEAVQNGTQKDGIILAGRTGFRNDNQIAVPAGWAAARNVTRLSDLAPYAGTIVFGSDLVFHEAKDGLPLLEKTYGFRFKDVKSMDPALMFESIRTGNVDAIVTYTTDTRIDLFNLTVLEDDRGGLPPYEAIYLVSKNRAGDTRFSGVIGKLAGRIDSAAMRKMNAAFDRDKKDAREIAREYLQEQNLI